MRDSGLACTEQPVTSNHLITDEDKKTLTISLEDLTRIRIIAILVSSADRAMARKVTPFPYHLAHEGEK